MVTRFGRFCRKLRIDNCELLSDMARRLGVSSAFLSKVENGLKKPPKTWEDMLIDSYQLNRENAGELREAIFDAWNYDSIDMSNFSEDSKNMLLLFARKLDVMDEEKKKQIRKMFETDGGN